jgi:hypothetical protein
MGDKHRKAKRGKSRVSERIACVITGVIPFLFDNKVKTINHSPLAEKILPVFRFL